METDSKPPAMLTNEGLARLIAVKDQKRAEIAATMTLVSQALAEEGISEGAEITEGWKDVNSFFPFIDNGQNSVLHVRLGPVADDSSRLILSMRELDPEIMREERKLVSTGDETRALRRVISEKVLIPNQQNFIIEAIKMELPLLKVLA